MPDGNHGGRTCSHMQSSSGDPLRGLHAVWPSRPRVCPALISCAPPPALTPPTSPWHSFAALLLLARLALPRMRLLSAPFRCTLPEPLAFSSRPLAWRIDEHARTSTALLLSDLLPVCPAPRCPGLLPRPPMPPSPSPSCLPPEMANPPRRPHPSPCKSRGMKWQGRLLSLRTSTWGSQVPLVFTARKISSAP